MAPRKKVKKFSVSKAVKANARERVGQPRPEKVILEKTAREARHKKPLTELIDAEE